MSKIDLHGCFKPDVKNFMDNFIKRILATTPTCTKIQFITGKGIHSKSPVGITYELLEWLKDY